MSILMPVPYCFDSYSFVLSFKIRKCEDVPFVDENTGAQVGDVTGWRQRDCPWAAGWGAEVRRMNEVGWPVTLLPRGRALRSEQP